MVTTSARLLQLLSLLQSRREWSGADLAERLEIAPRTLRRDVDRLRSLGYPVRATPGVAGGYRLAAGAAMPPLLLSDDEAVAVAVSLRTAAGGTVHGIEETAVRALTKLEQVLPNRLRGRVGALQSATVAITDSGPRVDPEVLTVIANACRDHETLRLDYVDHGGLATLRAVQPHWLVNWRRRWYLVCWDLAPDDWRMLRVDRITPRTPAGPRFEHRDPPDGDVAAYVSGRLGSALWPIKAQLRVHAPASAITGRTMGIVTPVDDRTCLLTLGAETLPMLAAVLGFLEADFEVVTPEALREHVGMLAERYNRAAH